MEAKHVNEFQLDEVLLEKTSKGLLRNPDRPLKNTDKRMVLRWEANPNLFRRNFETFDQMLYHQMVLVPHTVYPIPAGTRYILLTVQKTVLAHVPAETNKRPLEEKPESSSRWNRVFITPVIRPLVAPVLIARPSTALAILQPVSIPESPVQIPATPPVQIPPELTTPLVQIPDPPVQIPVFKPPVPTTPPVVETLEPTLTDDSSIDQMISFVFGDCSQQGLPPADTQDPQVHETVPSLFDESNDLISLLDHFETGLAIEQQETPMDLTMPRLKNKKSGSVAGSSPVLRARLSLYHHFLTQLWYAHSSVVWKNGDCFYESFGSDLGPRDRVEILSSGSSSLSPSLGCLSTSNYTTNAYILDFTDCTRVADLYVKWLTWLDDWERHRDDNVPWRMVGLQPWKRALEKHVQCSHEKALANGMPSDVTLLEHI
ncbi:hypothetical protein TNCV_1497861 [Trichonephila clavipes]|nr:hypothetical protein TNCV_1497861 [Trichonephila clavipes]